MRQRLLWRLLTVLPLISTVLSSAVSKQCLVDMLVEHNVEDKRVTKQVNHLTIHQFATTGYPSQISLHLHRYDGQAGDVTLNLVKSSIGRGLANVTGHKFDCHYSGSVRGNSAMHATVNLCTYGVSGVIISPASTVALTDIAGTFRLSDGLDLADDNIDDCPSILDRLTNVKSRSKRAVGDFPRYYSSYVDKTKRRYVELVLVQDNSVYVKYNQDYDRVLARTLEVANLVNALYSPLNIQITLVHFEIWQDRDQIDISTNSDRTLDTFLAYRQQRILPSHPHDNAHLITDNTFEAGVIGKAHKGTMCSYRQSGGVDLDHSHHALAVASTVSHEMAHNFGAEHDKADCECATDRCLMAPMTGGLAPTVWSSCSVEYIAHALSHGMDDCLLNEPRSIAASPTCGNGILEEGEECDCGVPEACNAMRCCVPETCKLKGEAKCGSGPCCDTQSCDFKSVGTVCRGKRDSECDLAEYCSGDSPQCPADSHVHDGIKCAGDNGYCSSGSCGSHTGQCQKLWGETGTKSPDICYSYNTRAQDQLSLIGNCGYNRDTRQYKSCSQTDALCGRLLCQHENEKTIYGSQTVVRTSHAYLSLGAKRYAHCRAAMFDFGESAESSEPGMVPDGASCGVDRMCRDVKCVRTSTVLDQVPCASVDCSSNGKCNNYGECHCDPGYGGWDCSGGGPGGSPRSGPASSSGMGMWTILLVLVLIGVPLTIIIVVCRRHRSAHSHKGGGNLLGSLIHSLMAFKPKPRRPPPPKTAVPRTQPPLPHFTPPDPTPHATVPGVKIQSGATWSPAADRKPLTTAVTFKANDYSGHAAVNGVYNPTTVPAQSASSTMSRSGTITKSDISAPVDYGRVTVPQRHAPPLPASVAKSTGHILDATAAAVTDPPVVVKERAATVSTLQRQPSIRPEKAPPSRPERPRESALVQLYAEQTPFQRSTIERKSSSLTRPAHGPPKPPAVDEGEDYYDIGTLPKGKPAPPPKASKPKPMGPKPTAAVKPVKVASGSKIADMAAKFEK